MRTFLQGLPVVPVILGYAIDAFPTLKTLRTGLQNLVRLIIDYSPFTFHLLLFTIRYYPPIILHYHFAH